MSFQIALGGRSKVHNAWYRLTARGQRWRGRQKQTHQANFQ